MALMILPKIQRPIEIPIMTKKRGLTSVKTSPIYPIIAVISSLVIVMIVGNIKFKSGDYACFNDIGCPSFNPPFELKPLPLISVARIFKGCMA